MWLFGGEKSIGGEMKNKYQAGVITEKQFEQQVHDLANLYGWLYYHTWRSIHSPAGFPDCVMARNSRIVFAELKGERGKVSLAQQGWLDALNNCNKMKLRFGDVPALEVYLWRPSDIDEIAGILS